MHKATHMGSARRVCCMCTFRRQGWICILSSSAVATQNSSGFVCVCCIMIIMKRSIICIPCRKFNSLMPLNPRRAGHNAAVMARVVDYFTCMANSFIHVWLPRCGNPLAPRRTRDAARRVISCAVIALPISPVSFQTGPVVSTIGQLTWPQSAHPSPDPLPFELGKCRAHFAQFAMCAKWAVKWEGAWVRFIVMELRGPKA